MHACSSSCAKERVSSRKKMKKKIHFVIIKIEFTPLRRVHILYTHTKAYHKKSTTERGKHRETGREIEQASKATFVAP